MVFYQSKEKESFIGIFFKSGICGGGETNALEFSRLFPQEKSKCSFISKTP